MNCPVCGEPRKSPRHKTCGGKSCGRTLAGRGNRGKSLSDEHRAAIGVVQRGRVFTVEHRERISTALRGRSLSSDHPARSKSPEWQAKLTSRQRGVWDTGTPAYRTIHSRLTRSRGRASEHHCVECGRLAVHWTFNHVTPPEFVRIAPARGAYAGARYSVRLEDYDPRCVPCHLRYDRHEDEQEVGIG